MGKAEHTTTKSPGNAAGGDFASPWSGAAGRAAEAKGAFRVARHIRAARPRRNSVIYDISKESKARAAEGAEWGCRVSLVSNNRVLYQGADPIAVH
jgi:hypothetical protein